ncbi:Mfs transporter, partial [Aspergillus sp. HF37]
MLFLGATLQVVAHALRFWLPPFSLFAAATFWLVSLGQAFQDSHANSFVATVDAAHRWLGFIHAMCAAGCLFAPLAATAVASAQSPSKWSLFYTVPLGLGTDQRDPGPAGFLEPLLDLILSSGLAQRHRWKQNPSPNTEPGKPLARSPKAIRSDPTPPQRLDPQPVLLFLSRRLDYSR